MTIMGKKKNPNQKRKPLKRSSSLKTTQKGRSDAQQGYDPIDCTKKEREAFMRQFKGLPCAVCGKTSWGRYKSSGHHILYVSTHPEYRLDPKNIIPLCTIHHVPFAHEKPLEFKEWLKKNKPKQYEWLVAHNHHRKN